MIVTTSIDGPGSRPARQGGPLVCSVDVEWTKNYRVPNGNRAFCYSAVWLPLPPEPASAGDLHWDYTSLYVDAEAEAPALVEAAAADLTAAMEQADLLVGHQLSSDLAVLAANGDPAPEALATARAAWHARAAAPGFVIDTRFDTGPILTGRSRRLVDVCTELGLDVTQPELGSKSMTALHRQWTDHGNTEARERITVLNLRHSLSAALVALRLTGAATWTGPVIVNRILHHQLHGTFDWLDSPTFRALVEQAA